MLAGSKEESPTAAWAKVKRKSTAGCCRPGLQSSHFLQSQEEEHVSQLWKTTSLFCLEISVHLLAAAQRLLSERYPNISQYQGLFCWGFFFHFLWIIGAVKSFTWAQNYLETEKKTKQISSCILFCICKQSVPRKMKMCGKLISLLTVEASEAFQVLYSFQLTQAGKVNNKTVAWKC